MQKTIGTFWEGIIIYSKINLQIILVLKGNNKPFNKKIKEVIMDL